MRDPQRIGPLLERLKAAWERQPDLRLGQLVANAALSAPGAWKGSLRYVKIVEDETLLELVEAVTDLKKEKP